MEKFESMVFGGSYNKHQAKCWKKNKCKRMIRVMDKRATSKSGGAAVALMNRVSSEEESSGEEERRQEELKERTRKNRRWRRKRERERNGELNIVPEGKIKVNKKIRNQQIKNELICTNCRKPLKGEIWQCGNGHSVCEKCFDKETYEEQITEKNSVFKCKGFNTLKPYVDNKTASSEQEELSTKSSSISKKLEKDFTLKKFNIETTLSQGSTCDSVLERSSYVRPDFDTVDFVKGTLDIRKDAIAGYEDYNGHLKQTDDEEEFDIKFGGYKVPSEDGTFVSEETLPEYEESVKDIQLHPKTLSELILDDKQREQDEVKESEEYKKKMEKQRTKLDFFRNTLDIRKDAIGTYDDYNALIYQNKNKNKDVDNVDSDDNTVNEEDDSTDDESSLISTILSCPVCQEPIEDRNISAEEFQSIFQTMMIYRDKMNKNK